MTNKFKKNGLTLQDISLIYDKTTLLPGEEQIVLCNSSEKQYMDVYCNGRLVTESVVNIGYTVSMLVCQLADNRVIVYNMLKRSIIDTIQNAEIMADGCGSVDNTIGYIILKIKTDKFKKDEYLGLIIEDKYVIVKYSFKSTDKISVSTDADETLLEIENGKTIVIDNETLDYRVEEKD